MQCWPVLASSVFTDYTKRGANGMAFEWSYSSYQGKFLWIFDQGKWNLVRVGGELELSEFELTE